MRLLGAGPGPSGARVDILQGPALRERASKKGVTLLYVMASVGQTVQARCTGPSTGEYTDEIGIYLCTLST